MYPNEIIFGMGLYEILMVAGFLCALLYFRFFADRIGFGAKMQNLVILCALAALVGGYLSAVLMQALYNGLEDGVFEVTGTTGATFYGGLIGGAAVFLVIYFSVGVFRLKKKEAVRNFLPLSDIAAGSIAVAHALGRLGCLFAGCCHGAVTDKWYGIYHHYLGAKAVPVQLYEAVFLLALFGYLTWRMAKGRANGQNLAVYLSAYAVWRFFIEYLRGDDRGATFLAFLSPSQLTAVLLFLLGVGILLLRRFSAAGKEREDEA